MTGRVAGAVPHLQRVAAQGDGVAVVQPASGCEGLRGRKAKALALHRQAVDPELVALVRTNDGQRQPLGQLAGAASMVDVGVGEPDLLKLQSQARHLGQEQVQVAAGVDHRGLSGGVVPDQGAVLFKRGDRNREVAEHAPKYARAGAVPV